MASERQDFPLCTCSEPSSPHNWRCPRGATEAERERIVAMIEREHGAADRPEPKCCDQCLTRWETVRDIVHAIRGAS